MNQFHLFGLILFFALGQSCGVYTGSLCGDVISRYSAPNPGTFFQQFTSEVGDEILNGGGFEKLSTIGPYLAPICYNVALKHFCSLTFPPCNGTGKMLLLFIFISFSFSSFFFLSFS